MKYQVWLNFRHPKTLETVGAARVYAHEDRLRAEAVLENAQADFQPLVLEMLRVHPGALVNAEMRQGFDPRNNPHDHAYMSMMIATLRKIAAFDDLRAGEYLKHFGGYAYFDEPEATKAAREALAQIGVTE